MTQRLDLLNPKPVTAPKPSLKFKPKVVARKTKEERDKDVPVSTKLEKSNTSNRGRPSTRARGRGGRGSYAGTHMVSSGPLASGSVSLGNSFSSSKSAFTRDSVYSSLPLALLFIQTLRAKSSVKVEQKSSLRHGENESEGDEEDDPNDLTRINMSKSYNFAEEDTLLFPVRPIRDEPRVQEKEQTPPVTVPSSSISPEPSESIEPQIVVKQEPSDETPRISDIEVNAGDDFTAISEHKKQLESKMALVAIADSAVLENEQYLRDQRSIADLVHKISQVKTTEDEPTPLPSYFALHLPQKLPSYETDAMEDVVAESQNLFAAASHAQHPTGQIGTLNIHKSGKISINLGNDINLLVSMGNAPSFAQDLYVLDSSSVDPEAGKAANESEEEENMPGGDLVRLGAVTHKIVASPALE